MKEAPTGYERRENGLLGCLQCDEELKGGFGSSAHFRAHERRNEPGPCVVCGRRTLPFALEVARGVAARCHYCGAAQDEWAFLRDVPQLGDRLIRLRCPHAAPGRYAEGVRCHGSLRFPARDFATVEHVGGNGPYSYLLDTRLGIQGRCRVCDSYGFATELILSNRAAIARTLA